MSLDSAPRDSAPIYDKTDRSTKIIMRPRIQVRLLAGATIFLSSFLLFSIQPMFAKMILPWFGGSAAVWTTCLVFFQTALLAGYWYAWVAVKRLRPRPQAMMHTVLLALAIALLPVEAGPKWRPAPDSLVAPAVRILLMLTAVLGLPYFLLSTTGPLLQSWYARFGLAEQADAGQASPAGSENRDGNPAQDSAKGPTVSRPYRLFAVSNAGALIALMAYPLWIEPRLPIHVQERLWSVGFVIFAALCAITAWVTSTLPVADTAQAARSPEIDAPTLARRLEWIALSAV